MASENWRLGIVGGTGMLGREIAGAVLSANTLPPERLWISSRRGADGASGPTRSCRHTSSNQELADACDVILLSVPPATSLDLGMLAASKLVISVMAGIPVDMLQRTTGTNRVVRAMSSPAAGLGLAYSPWFASAKVTTEDRHKTRAILSACGLDDELETEEHIDCFTALTGPVPGFVAYFADAMAGYARKQGVAPDIADRAVRQLFKGAATLMSDGTMTPADHVQQMIDYAGTTAAGLNELQQQATAAAISKGLDAAVHRTRSIAPSSSGMPDRN